MLKKIVLAVCFMLGFSLVADEAVARNRRTVSVRVNFHNNYRGGYSGGYNMLLLNPRTGYYGAQYRRFGGGYGYGGGGYYRGGGGYNMLLLHPRTGYYGARYRTFGGW